MKTQLAFSATIWVMVAFASSADTADKKLLPHPDALPNTHKPGEVDDPKLVPFIVRSTEKLPGVVVDETQAKLVGKWRYSTHTPPYVGLGYLHDQKQGKGESSVTFTPSLPAAGVYEVRLSHCYNIRRATNTPVTIHHADGETALRINQQETPAHKRLFRTLGKFRFERGNRGWVRISTEGTDGKYVIADAVQFIPVATRAAPLRIATFQIDATPPLGSPLCNGNVKPVMRIVSPLTARGVVLLGSEEPIVLCAFDWVGIGNESYDAFRQAVGKAVGTSADRVAVHTLHQHDAPGSDFATERLLAQHGLSKQYSNPDFDAQVMERLAAAAKRSLRNARVVTHVGLGVGRVEKVASNRRILGGDGRVAIQRQSSGGRNPAARDAPVGTIDPLVRLIAFWNDEQPLGVMTYYATHPQSYYGQGEVNWDFVGMARAVREQALPGVPHIHFDGAGGNVAAGKYNDGAKQNRPVLAGRLAAGMKLAWQSQQKTPVSGADVSWLVQPVSLPVRNTLIEAELLQKISAESNAKKVRLRAARDLVFLRRMKQGHRIPLTCLRIGNARVLHMPGELFVEYQLAAQQLRPNDFVAMAAYGDYGPGYIGTQIAYGQGGYETGIVSRVAPTVETTLTEAVKRLLEVKD
ncbi:MAG: hypothetical protein QGG36_31330 [Pirellulaceae bacterium]|jgi:hypothetical protein|nr:hypothetical protein [Pirellulaceae bacterium]MDP7020332.1 hypothetical protein [Pirellulaceae bacterium]